MKMNILLVLDSFNRIFGTNVPLLLPLALHSFWINQFFFGCFYKEPKISGVLRVICVCVYKLYFQLRYLHFFSLLKSSGAGEFFLNNFLSGATHWMSGKAFNTPIH